MLPSSWTVKMISTRAPGGSGSTSARGKPRGLSGRNIGRGWVPVPSSPSPPAPLPVPPPPVPLPVPPAPVPLPAVEAPCDGAVPVPGFGATATVRGTGMTTRGLGRTIGVASAFFAGGAAALGLAEAGFGFGFGLGGGGGIWGGGGTSRTSNVLRLSSIAAGVRCPAMPSSMNASPTWTATTATIGPARSRGERSPEYTAVERSALVSVAV